MRGAGICLAAAMIAGLSGFTARAGDMVAPQAGALPADLGAAGLHEAILAQRLARRTARLPAPTAGTATTAAPTIHSCTIITPTVNVLKAPASPAFTCAYSAPGGLANIQFEYSFEGASAELAGPFFDSYYEAAVPNLKSGSITVQQGAYGLSLYAPRGKWIVYTIVISDFANNTTYYSGSALSAVMPNATFAVINNGTVDIAPPQVLSGKLLTPKVSLGSANPYFEAELTVADNVSGVENIQLFLQGPSSTTSTAVAYGETPSPATKSTTVVVGLNMSGLNDVGDSPVGTWTITGYAVDDWAGNTLRAADPNDLKKLFGKTAFEVTK
jgi:hypothetical protein